MSEPSETQLGLVSHGSSLAASDLASKLNSGASKCWAMARVGNTDGARPQRGDQGAPLAQRAEAVCVHTAGEHLEAGMGPGPQHRPSRAHGLTSHWVSSSAGPKLVFSFS